MWLTKGDVFILVVIEPRSTTTSISKRLRRILPFRKIFRSIESRSNISHFNYVIFLSFDQLIETEKCHEESYDNICILIMRLLSSLAIMQKLKFRHIESSIQNSK